MKVSSVFYPMQGTTFGDKLKTKRRKNRHRIIYLLFCIPLETNWKKKKKKSWKNTKLFTFYFAIHWNLIENKNKKELKKQT